MISSPWTDTRGTPLSFPHMSIAGNHRGKEKPWFCVLFYALSSVTHQVTSLKTFKNITNLILTVLGIIMYLHYIYLYKKKLQASRLYQHINCLDILQGPLPLSLSGKFPQGLLESFHRVSFGSHKYCHACFSLPTVESFLYPLSYRHTSCSAADNSSLSDL